MVDLDVQRKKKTSWIPWLIAAIILLLLILFFTRGCNTTHNVTSTNDTTTTSVGPANGGAVATTTPANDGDWSNIDRNAPIASYAEISDKNINVRGNDNYGIYSLGEDVLFESGNSTIKNDAVENLKQITASINQRFKGGDIRVYGYTDAVGSKDYNKDLAKQRAEAVRTWLATTGGMDSSKISINAIGEDQPAANNDTEKGRQQNRRVEVVARKAQ